MRYLIFLLLLVLLFPSSISAHEIGQPPFLKINGVFTNYYPVPSTSAQDFKVPQDITAVNYLVGEELSFELDVPALPAPEQIVKESTFTSDFGDGSRVIGLTANHKYQAPGTYFMNLEVTSPQIIEPLVLQSTAINILPRLDYKLPKAVIKVNNKESKDPLLDILQVDFEKEITFNASSSDRGDSEIVEYFWDLGDGNSKTGKTFKYKYSENPYIVFPVLRVKTRDGFISDAYVQLSDANTNFESGNSNPFSSIFDWKVITASAFLALILTGIIFLIFRKYFTAKRR